MCCECLSLLQNPKVIDEDCKKDERRVTKFALRANSANAMTYDGDGKRRSYADSVILRNFIWDGENIARQTDVNNLTDRNYTLNPQLGVYPERSERDSSPSDRVSRAEHEARYHLRSLRQSEPALSGAEWVICVTCPPAQPRPPT